VVVEDDVGPAPASIDRKAAILGEAALDFRSADKVGHGIRGHRAELNLSRLGRLEEHIGVAVSIELRGSLCSH